MSGAGPYEEGDRHFEEGDGHFEEGGRREEQGAGGGGKSGGEEHGDSGRSPRIPMPRVSVEDSGLPLPIPDEPDIFPTITQLTAPTDPSASPEPKGRTVLEHHVLKSLLGAWALAACSGEETAAVEEHLGGCGDCAEEALRLRDAVGLLHRPDSLDLDPGLRTRVLASCLEHRPPRFPVPDWAAPYDAETARLDALLQDIGDSEWDAPVRLRWFDGEETASRRTTVAGVIAHLTSVDGLVAVALGLDDPLRDAADGPGGGAGPTPEARTEAYWRSAHLPPAGSVRVPWREQTHTLVRTVSVAGGAGGASGTDTGGTGTRGTDADEAGTGGAEGIPEAPPAVSYGDFELPLRDALLDRAFECWVHAEDIAEAVDYPYEPPAPRHLRGMIDLAARMLPGMLAARRRAGLASPARTRHLVAAGRPGRSLRLEIEGLAGGEWLIPLDSPGAVGSAGHEVAHVALDGVEFCRLAAGHIAPREAAVGQVGDREAIRDVLYAAASLSRL
ncbi:zf-HC2 domain-containing protein [Streptomyces sp. MK5]|uniref:zf-HC2 domain-containing protein n=1 Tax=Streptomyces sp. MK5 TaxID=3064253 RepID=UPI002741D41C|nr:zf-HC2 domain-containing protein [Streptomyces sp. MK5]